MNSNSLLFALLFDLAASFLLVYMVARTAKSKGRGAITWGVLALVSATIVTGFAIFMRPRGLAAETPYRAKPLSLLAYVGGIASQLWGFSALPIDSSMSDQQLVDALTGQASVGALMIVGSGLLLMNAAVGNEKISAASPSDQ